MCLSAIGCKLDIFSPVPENYGCNLCMAGIQWFEINSQIISAYVLPKAKKKTLWDFSAACIIWVAKALCPDVNN